MDINFEDYDKKFKSNFLKVVENNIKIIKNLFDDIFINEEGLGYNLESKVSNGRVIIETTLNEIFEIEKDTLLKLNCKNLADCLKAGKTKILGCFDIDNKLIFRTTEMDYTIGEYQKGKRLNLQQIEDIQKRIGYNCSLNDLIPKFINKEFINEKKGRYDLILTHKLFPMINKSSSFDFYATENGDGTFFGTFKNTIEEKNKKGEVTFSMNIKYIYRFIDLN